MRRLKRSAYALLFALSLVTSLVVSSGTASATSDYDDVIDSVGSVHLSRDGSTQGSPACAPLDITSSWASILTNSSSWTSRTQIIGGATQSATLADWATTLNNGVGWAVVQQHNSTGVLPNDGSPIADAVYVVFTPSTSAARVEFSSTAVYYGVQKQAHMVADSGYVYSIRIQFDDLGSSGGSDQCTPVISMALRDTTPSTWFKELLSVAATSTESTGGYSLRPLFVNAPVNYPSGYEGEIVSTEPPSAHYVALGDSYSSGEGNPPYEYGSDTNTNVCHRSESAWPRLLQDDPYLGLSQMMFAACSGAVSDYLINSYNLENVELPQAVYVSEDTDFVTLTIGGNDIDFAPTLAACVASTTAQTCLDAIATANSKAADPDLVTAIEDVLTGIKSLGEDDTQVIAVGYPQLYPEYANISGSCTWGSPLIAPYSGGRVSGRTITEGEIDELREVHDILNGAIASAVDNTSDPDIHFVDPTSTFETHEICGSSTDWLHEVFLHASTGDLEVGSFHPNADGQAAYADVVGNRIGELN